MLQKHLQQPQHLLQLQEIHLNSFAKLIVCDKQTSKLKHDLIDKLVVLRMNLNFMIYSRGKNGSIGKVKKLKNDLGNDEDIYEDDYE